MHDYYLGGGIKSPLLLITIGVQSVFFINGIEDGKSMFLKGSRQTKNTEFNYIFGRTPELKGVNAYLDRFQIYSRELETCELTPSYSFLQSTRDPFILHGWQSWDYAEAELVWKNIRIVGIRTKEDFDKSDYTKQKIYEILKYITLKI